MANTLTGTFWGTPLEDIALWDSGARRNIGIVDSLNAERLNCQLQLLLAKHSCLHLNARQVAAQMRGVVNPGEVLEVMPPHCTEKPPATANSWSDGSVSCPAQANFRLGGTAVWHPCRNESDDPPHILKKE